MLQIDTLSFAYHSVFWIKFGLVGAWWSAARAHKPDLDVRMTPIDLALRRIHVRPPPLLLRVKGV